MEAYPIVIYTKQLLDGSRKIMEIIEGEDYVDGQLQYRTLYRYDVVDNCIKPTPAVHSHSQIPSPLITETAEFGLPEPKDAYEENEVAEVIGHHMKVNTISETLKRRFLDNGIPARELRAFIKEEC